MKVKHFGRFVITPEGVRLLDADMHYRKVAEEDRSAKVETSTEKFDVGAMVLKDDSSLSRNLMGRHMSELSEVSSAEAVDEAKESASSELRCIELECSIHFLKVSRGVMGGVDPEYQQPVLDQIACLEKEAQAITGSQDTRTVQALSDKVKALGRKILALSNL